MIHVAGSIIVCGVGVALYLAILDRSPFRTALFSAFGFNAGLGMGSGFWVPTALQGLGATPSESWIGMALTTGWAGFPQSLLMTIALKAIRPRSAAGRIAWASAVVVAIEYALLRLPGAVPWTLLGYSAAEDPGLAQLAAFGGVPGVSGAIAGLGRAGAEFFVPHHWEQDRRPALSTVLALALTSLIGLKFVSYCEALPPGEAKTQFLAVQPNIPRIERHFPSAAMQRATLDRLISVSRQALAATTAIDDVTIVWPETSVVVGEQGMSRVDLASALAAIGAPSIVGASMIEGPEHESARNAILSFDSRGKPIARVDKSLGVPVIESDTHGTLFDLARWLIGQAGDARKVSLDNELRPLDDARGAVVLLCFEALFPFVAEARRPDNARVILNLADDSWIDSSYATRQLTAILRFRAIEQHLPALRVAHGGLSASFDRFGQPLGEVPLDQYGWLPIDTLPAFRPNPWRQAAIWILPFGGAMMTYAGLSWMVRRWPSLQPWLGRLSPTLDTPADVH